MVAPDGGWGWAACFGVSLVNVSVEYLPKFRLMCKYWIRKKKKCMNERAKFNKWFNIMNLNNNH